MLFLLKHLIYKLKMNIRNSNPRHGIPLWQSEKMRAIIADRWEEVWDIVETRNNHRRNLYQYWEGPQRNSNF